VPDVSLTTLPTPEAPSIVGPEPPTPLPDGLVGDDDSPLRKKLLDIAEAQRESVIQPDRVTDDRGEGNGICGSGSLCCSSAKSD
jgi:hypothetical protein